MFLILFIINLACTQAQSLTGRIVDDQSNPLAFANIMLLNSKDSSFIIGAISEEDGTFKITNSEEKSLVKVSCFGYKTRILSLDKDFDNIIKLSPEAHIMKEVTVKATLPQYKISDNGMIIDIEHTVLKHAGSADDILS